MSENPTPHATKAHQGTYIALVIVSTIVLCAALLAFALTLLSLCAAAGVPIALTFGSNPLESPFCRNAFRLFVVALLMPAIIPVLLKLFFKKVRWGVSLKIMGIFYLFVGIIYLLLRLGN